MLQIDESPNSRQLLVGNGLRKLSNSTTWFISGTCQRIARFFLKGQYRNFLFGQSRNLKFSVAGSRSFWRTPWVGNPVTAL
jgi:hypothetical protein